MAYAIIRPRGQPVQRSPPSGGESETLVVGVCLLSSGFTRGLVLGMRCAALRPPSKPGTAPLGLQGISASQGGKVPPVGALFSRRLAGGEQVVYRGFVDQAIGFRER